MPTHVSVPTRSAASPAVDHDVRVGVWWTLVTALEVGLAAAVVLVDWLIPSVVLVAMAGISLLIRRSAPRTLGFHRPAHPWRMAAQMLAFATVWTLLNISLLIPITNHLSGRRQDVSVFADLQGNLGLLGAYLTLSWVLAAFCEETAFRGYLMTRLRQLLGTGPWALTAAVIVSSTLFGLLHTEQGIVGVIISGLTGAVFVALRYRLGTLWAPILAHGFGDTIGFTWFFFFGPMYGLW